MYVKVCGLVNTDQIDKAMDLGYDAIGVVTYPKSKRYCPPDKARILAQYAKGKIDSFVVGKTFSDVQEAMEPFDYIQIYESIALPNLVLASKHKPPGNFDYTYFMYDSSVGSGVFNAFPQWLKQLKTKVLIAGGLNHENVCQVIQEIRPFGVDISSGVEKDGVKDFRLMQLFIETVRSCVG